MFKKNVLCCLGLFVGVMHAGQMHKTCDITKELILKEALVVLYKQAMDALNHAQTQIDLTQAITIFLQKIQYFGIAHGSRVGLMGMEPHFDVHFEERGICALRYLLHTRAMRSEQIALQERNAQELTDCDVFSRY